ncbi:hypothetical protein QJQ45_022636, partial [Haematococcus lacustris]
VKKKVAILPSKPVSVSVGIVLLPLEPIVAAVSIQQGPADGVAVQGSPLRQMQQPNLPQLLRLLLQARAQTQTSPMLARQGQPMQAFQPQVSPRPAWDFGTAGCADEAAACAVATFVPGPAESDAAATDTQRHPANSTAASSIPTPIIHHLSVPIWQGELVAAHQRCQRKKKKRQLASQPSTTSNIEKRIECEQGLHVTLLCYVTCYIPYTCRSCYKAFLAARLAC